MRSLKALSEPQSSLISIARMTSAGPMTAPRRKLRWSGWRDGKFLPPALSTTAHCSVSASSTSRAMPAGVRASLSQRITGFSAATSILASSAIEPESACGGAPLASFGVGSGSASPVRFFLKSGATGVDTRSTRGVHPDLVGAHHRLGEMLERCRLVVPFDEIAHDRARIDRRMHPFSAGRALIGLDDVAAEDNDRHAVAPGVVHRHGRVLEADHAVAD